MPVAGSGVPSFAIRLQGDNLRIVGAQGIVPSSIVEADLVVALNRILAGEIVQISAIGSNFVRLCELFAEHREAGAQKKGGDRMG